MLLAASVLWPSGAEAQSFLQVTSCGTAPRTLPPGAAGVVLVDANGNLCETGSVTQGTTPWVVNLQNANSATYSAISSGGNNGYTTPTDLLCLRNPGTKIVRALQFNVFANQTSAALDTGFFILRSALNTGGTSSSPTPTAFDLSNPAVSAAVDVYTGAPTLGTAAGTVQYIIISVPAPTSSPANISLTGNIAGSSTGILNSYATPITIRQNQELCFNWNGAALPAGFAFGYNIVWSESAN